jgi:hypothetical protein
MFDDFLAEFWFVFAIPLAIIVFFFFAVVGACLIEKRYVQTFSVPEEGKEYPLSPTAQQYAKDAAKLQFTHAGLCHHAKSDLYRIRYDFWTSPDLKTLAVIGSGTLIKIPVKGIWLWSRTTDGRILNSTNEIGEQEISTNVIQQTLPDASFTTLASSHATWLSQFNVETFTADSALSVYFDIRRSKVDNLIERGYAYYIDEDQSAWKFTLKGALVFYFKAMWIRPISRGLQSIGIKVG